MTFPVTTNIHNPSLLAYLPEPEKATGAAVIIAPARRKALGSPLRRNEYQSHMSLDNSELSQANPPIS